MDKMIPLAAKSQIMSILTRLAELGSPMYLWQNPASLQRIAVKVRFSSFDPDAQDLIFYPKNSVFAFNGREPIYFYSKRQMIIFKSFTKYNSHHKLVLSSPNKIMLRNLRQEKRVNCQNEDIYARYMRYNMHSGPYESSSLKSKLLDKSKSGIAIKSSLNNILKFQVGDFVKVQGDINNELINGQVKYVNVQTDFRSKEKFYRIGICYQI